MSYYYLIDLNCDLIAEVSQGSLTEIQQLIQVEEKPLRDFPGWSKGRMELVEKWENYSRYTLSLRFQLHDDVFENWDYHAFLNKIAAISRTQGFVGIIYSSMSE